MNIADLSRRERQVLGLMARALSNEAIAALLCLQLRTVEHYIERMYRKLELSGPEWNTRVRAVVALREAA